MTPEDLEQAWNALALPQSTTELAAAPLAGSDVWAALDHDGQRHVLLRVSDEADAPPTSTRGLRLAIARHQVAGGEPGQYLDMTCLSPELTVTFDAVAAEIVTGAGSAAEAKRVDLVIQAMSRWQWFWDIESDRLSEMDALGLFAELWYLHRWEGSNRESLEAWTASSGSRHDFQWAEKSVEVKATSRRSEGAVLHRIQHLDQLADPEQGILFLFSLRVVHDELANNTLPTLVDQISASLYHDFGALEEFMRKLGSRGYSPAFRDRHETRYRVLGESLYRVGPGFPRLTPELVERMIPAGVMDISYVLDMAACGDWLVATSPSER